MSQFKTIPNTNGKYEISKEGVVRHSETKAVRNTYRVNGYVQVSLKLDGKARTYGVHRLLVLSYCSIEGSENLHVNHINGKRSDNRLSNLEWATPAENAAIPKRTKGQKGVYSFPNPRLPFRAVLKIDGKTKTVGYYTNELDAREAYEDAFTAHYGFSPTADRISVSQLPKAKKLS